MHKYIFAGFVVFLLINSWVSGCELESQTQHGCKIENSQCVCGFGCKSEFRYNTRKECQDTLKGRANDICGRIPCLNGGTCIQTSAMPSYKCKCEGTGYWGNRCQRLCPRENHTGVFPHECVEI